jgi:prepilin-type N-terminal cleavage/methylation domain-containing protein
MTLPSIARSRDGFTLTELIVALVLMAAAAGIVLPSISRTLNEGKINQVSSVVVTTLRESTSLAGRRRRPVRVSIDTVARVIRLRDHLAPDSVFRTLWLNESGEYALSVLAASDTQLVVFPNGLRTKATNTWPMTVTLTIGDDQRRVSLTRAGQIRTTTP